MNVSSLHVAGVALALGTTAFASLMILRSGDAPGIAGIVPQGAGTPWKKTIDTDVAGGIDYTPVGSLPSASAGSGGSSQPGGYRIRSAMEGMALVEGPEGLVAVRPGSVLPGVGRVEAIEHREGKWHLVLKAR
jgi:hypothetical protein